MRLAVTRGLTWPRGDTETVSIPQTPVFSGERISKAVIVALFSAMVARIARDTVATGHATGLLMLTSEALVVVFTVIRRPAGVVDRTVSARALTLLSTFGAQFVRPASLHPLAPEWFTLLVSATGLIVVVLGKASLGRSFGLTPANRGVVSTGLYQFVRHPIYVGYLFVHVGFLIANPTVWNLSILAAGDIALMFRAVREERTLAADPVYRAYMQRVHWRVVPGLF
jgi:protein-S-isoprenylcysteine O-methyltransferase Ste14